MSTVLRNLSALAVFGGLALTAVATTPPPSSLATSAPAMTASASAMTMASGSVTLAGSTPREGDGFWFASGVQATLLNRVVRMAPDTPGAIRTLVANVVGQINTHSGAGVTIGPDTTGPPATSEIVVRVPTQTVCGPAAAGCASNAVASVDGYGVVVNALVELKRDLIGSGYELPILLHEMGHAMGLGHYDQAYDGRMQVMWNSVTPDMTSYRSGDRNGLAALGAVFTNRNVSGTIDRIDLVPGGLRVRGWAIDFDAPELSLETIVTLNGIEVADLADRPRPDVGAVYPAAGANHGIDLTVPTAGVEGPVTVCVVVIGHRNQPVGVGCRASTAVHRPLGSLDLARQRGPGTIETAGWAIDPDTPEPVTVEVSVDGVVVGASGTDRARPDVTLAYPGFPGERGWALVATGIAPGNRRVCAVARDLTGDPDQLLGCRTVAVAGGNPFGTIDGIAPSTATPLRLRGWAIDPDTTDPIHVHLYIDGRFARQALADRQRPDVGRVYRGFGDNHGFDVALPGLARGPHVACLFAINRLAGTQNTLLGCVQFTTAGAAPIGNVDAVTTVEGRRSLVGWAIDPDTIDPISVHVWVNGRYFSAGRANQTRLDVGRAYPAYGSQHGFAIPIDGLPRGTHRICAYGIDAGTTGPNPLLGCRWVTQG